MKHFHINPDFDSSTEQDLAPELEWILQSSQVSLPVLAQALVREQFAPIYALAASILGDSGLAYFAAFEALIETLSNLHQFQNGGSAGSYGARNWLYRRVLDKIARIRRQAPLQDSLQSLLPFRKHHGTDHLAPPSAGLTPELAAALDSLPEPRRLALILIRLQDWPAAETASLLNVPERDLANWIEEDWHQLDRALPPPQLNPGAEPLSRKEDRRKEAIWLHWGPPTFTPADQEKFEVEILDQVESRMAQREQFASVQELAWLAVIILLVFGLLWWVGSTDQEEPIEPGIVQHGIGEIETSLAQPTGQPEATVPLSLDSGDAAIRLRLVESHRLWRSFWGDARIVYYGPPGYIGPYSGYRAQVWLNQPRQSLAVYASLGKPPSRVVLVDGYQRTFYDVRQKRMEFRPATGVGLLAQLEAMIFPNGLEWLDQAGTFQASQMVVIEGREVLVVDLISPGGQLQARLWLDTNTGIILRQQQMSETDSGTIVSDFRFTRFTIDPGLSPTLFRLEENQEIGFVDRADQLPQNTPAPPAEAISIPGRPRLSRSPDVPPDFDPARSPLSFDFWPNYDEDGNFITASSRVFADLYAHDPSPFGPAYYLGRVPFADPFGPLICSRSPDGRRVAFASLTDPSRMGWFDLDKPQDVHIALPGDYVHELAFAPDGNRLAVSVTEKWTTRRANRILILETDASLVWELGETIYPARSLAWSPEGRYLSLLDADPFDEPPKQNELVVLDVETGEKVYSAQVALAIARALRNIPEQDNGLAASLPANWPGHEWGVEFPVPQRGLEGCAARTEPAAQLSYPTNPVPAGHALIGVRTPINRNRNQVALFSVDPAIHDPPDTAAAWIEPTYPGERQTAFLDDSSQAISGDRIGFVMSRSLYLLKMDGSPPHRIAGPFEHPISATWSPTGGYVAYLLKYDDGFSDLHILDLACADLPEGCRDQLPGTRIVAQQEVHRLAWSPAGSRLVFEKQKGNDTGKTDLYMVDLQAGSAEPHVVGLTGGMARGGLSTHWLPDGQALVYLEVQPGDPCRSDLIKIGVHDSSIKKILADLSCEVVDFTVSPDGQMLAFVALNLFNSRSESQAISRRVNPSIWLWQVGDEGRSDLVQIQAPEGSQGRISSPVFSFDGKSLLFKTAMERVMHLDLESGEVRTLFEVPQPGYQETPWFWPRIFTILFQSP